MRKPENCSVCGCTLEIKRLGRPAEYCGHLCRKFREYQRKLAGLVYQVQFTVVGAMEARSEIWAIGNDCRPAIDRELRQRWGLKLRRFRWSRGWTQVQAGATVGITGRRWGHLESAGRPATLTERQSIQVVLDTEYGRV